MNAHVYKCLFSIGAYTVAVRRKYGVRKRYSLDLPLKVAVPLVATTGWMTTLTQGLAVGHFQVHRAASPAIQPARIDIDNSPPFSTPYLFTPEYSVNFGPQTVICRIALISEHRW